jgi:signal transduction histidine kinase
LPRKIRIVFILQLTIVSVAILLSYYIALSVFGDSVVRATLRKEADYYWTTREASPDARLPNVYNLRGYFLAPGEPLSVLPKELRGLSLGFHSLDDGAQAVLVERRETGTLYLIFMARQAINAGFWYGFLPAILAVLLICLVTWQAYRFSKRLIAPVTWLARRVSRWDPRNPDVSELAPDKLPASIQEEAKQLANALYILAVRMTAQLAREQNFTRDASHELRTPLTVIRVASDMGLTDPDLTPRLERALRRIQRAGRDMEAVIDAFLILARESGIEPQREWFDVCEVVEYEVDNARHLLGDKPIMLSLECAAHPTLHGSPRALHVVVSNLLRNACNYTDQGQIKVFVEEDRVRVQDSGIGMSAETVAQVFEPFFRAEQDRGQGVGLGLSIVRRLSDRCGWTVELESAPGEGTTVSLCFVA